MTPPSAVRERAAFSEVTEPYRRELLAHCYRLLGAVDEAEDLVQETYLRAWRSYDGFEGRSSLRTWLYQIATNVCLSALDRRSRRPLPSGLGAPGHGHEVGEQEVEWLQPIPDALVTPESDDPAVIAVSRESLRLALIASLQYLPARQRAVLILRDVLAFSASEVADILDTTTVAVKSALQRARARLELEAPAGEELSEPAEPEARAVLDRYIAAFETADAQALKDLLRADARLELPPSATWYRGDGAVATAVEGLGTPGEWRMVATAANGQPAAATYRRDASGEYRAYGVVVLTTTRTQIAALTVFGEPALVAWFGLPPLHRAIPS
jgi:RNA polymerase sigma-70 factor (ECF subfamily)